ncbi:MAG TPA: EAL domain-containing protein [Xanthomonadaceae bacterium]|jgi:diguanylate cyclase (GGDEF)-like protein|nr:EAL domain-containing protein [Xanthomonadaceae bacterium]
MASDREWIRNAVLPQWVWLAAFLAYVIAAALGLGLALPGTNASPFWPPTALTLALLYRHGLRFWPVVMAGALTINFLFMLRAGVLPLFALPASIGVGIGNTLEATIGIWLLRRFAGDRSPFRSLRGLGAFVLFCAALAPAVSASIGVTISRWANMSGTSDYGENWLTWWVGDASGALTMAPILMLTLHARWLIPTRPRLLEAGALFLALVLGTMTVFGLWLNHGEHRYPLVFFLLPIILWAVLRFQTAGAASAVFLISLIAAVGSLNGGGPFARENVHESLMLLQVFILVLAGTTLGLAAVLADRSRMASMLAQANRELHELAFNDPLTGLPNRLTLLDRLQQAERSSRRDNKRAAILFLDLDRFKRINDSLGHQAGDVLLRTTADRLRSAVREVDTVCRLGGDEFVVLLSGIDAATDAAIVADKIIQCLRAPMRLGQLDLAVTTSIGIALVPDDGTDSGELIRHADLAMYRAKQRGRNNFLFYAEEMNQDAVAGLERELELRQALVDRQFCLFYQPIVDLRDGKVIGIEALLRWQHPKFGLLLPREFIPQAEESGLLVEIGAWALKEAGAQIRRLRDGGQEMLKLSVNLSLRQLHDRNLPGLIARALEETGLDGRWLTLEIDERMLHQDLLARLNFLHDLGRIGISLTMDGLGSAGSSLNLLKRLPVSVVKIDQDLVSQLQHDPAARDISLAIIAMSHRRGLAVIAECVETPAQRDFLIENGCDFAQGFCFHPPLPLAELSALLTDAREASLYERQVVLQKTLRF